MFLKLPSDVRSFGVPCNMRWLAVYSLWYLRAAWKWFSIDAAAARLFRFKLHVRSKDGSHIHSEVNLPSFPESSWRGSQPSFHSNICWTLAVPKQGTESQFSQFERIFLLIFINDSHCSDTVWRNTYILVPAFYFLDCMLQEIYGWLYDIFRVFAFFCGRSIKFCHEAFQCSSEALCLWVRENYVLASLQQRQSFSCTWTSKQIEGVTAFWNIDTW